jgi:hypothetical protein
MGDAGDVIDRELEKGTRLPGTIRLYLSSLIKFLEWESGNSTWLRHLRLSFSVDLTLQVTGKCERNPQWGCKCRYGCQVNKMFKYFSIVSSHEKKCGCIQEWIIDISGLHLGNQTWEAIYTILPFYGMVICKLLLCQANYFFKHQGPPSSSGPRLRPPVARTGLLPIRYLATIQGCRSNTCCPAAFLQNKRNMINIKIME